MIKNIIFDMGNVLLKFDRNYFLDAVGVKPADRRTLMNNVYLSLEWAKMDRGSMTEEEAADYVKQSDAYARRRTCWSTAGTGRFCPSPAWRSLYAS